MLREHLNQIKKEPNFEMPSVSPRGEPLHENEAGPDHMICCAGCSCAILDRFYLKAVDKEWHVQCLRCCECKVPLDSNTTCFAREGNVYCKEDYYRRFAMKKCARCQMEISSNELVMKARQYVYHIHCFCCTSCHKVLSTGEYFGMHDEMLFCKTHYDQGSMGSVGSNNSTSLGGSGGSLLHSLEHHDSDPAASPPNGNSAGPGGPQFCDFLKRPPTSHADFMDFQARLAAASGNASGGGVPNHHTMMGEPPHSHQHSHPHPHPGMPTLMQAHAQMGHYPGSAGGPQPPFYNGVGSTQKGRPRKRKNQPSDLDMMCGDGDEISMTSDGMLLSSTRQKRIRTSFKHQQLRVLKSYFALNQNPDAKDLKQLSQKTGLAKRVLQVWFQNARAKYRRNMLKQQNDTPPSNNNNKSNTNDTDLSPTNNNQSMDSSEFPDIPDMRNSQSPTAMSDLSSTPSLSDLHSTNGGQLGRPDVNIDMSSGGSNFTDLFSHVTSSMNGFL